jgi:hypothetical protein
MNHHFQYSRKELGRHAKNAVLRELQMISKNLFAVNSNKNDKKFDCSPNCWCKKKRSKKDES